MHRAALATLVALAACPSAAHAQGATADETPEGGTEPVAPAVEDVKDHGFTLGARLALSLPLGNAADTVSGAPDPQSSEVLFAAPIGIDAGYRFARHHYVGAFGQFAPALVPSGCPTAFCFDERLGLDYQYHGRGAKNDPWVGAGLGYEILHGGGGSTTVIYRGWELLHLQGGLDFYTGRRAELGPFAMLSFGKYTTVRDIGPQGDVTADISQKAFHAWLQFGVQGELDL